MAALAIVIGLSLVALALIVYWVLRAANGHYPLTLGQRWHRWRYNQRQRKAERQFVAKMLPVDQLNRQPQRPPRSPR